MNQYYINETSHLASTAELNGDYDIAIILGVVSGSLHHPALIKELLRIMIEFPKELKKQIADLENENK